MGDHGRALTDRLYDSGALRDPGWRSVFAAVERHRFVPGRAWSMTAQRRRQTLDRAADPAAWLAAAYADAAIVTQVDDGAPGGPGTATSSLSQPTVVAWMLEALDVAPGHRVLEIGTGPGWNAGLLAARAGDANVTTVEVDAALAATARATLAAVGRTPTVVAADGADGHPPGAPYDRVIATCGVRTVPYAWVAQTRPGGRVLLPWTPAVYAGTLLPLDVAGDGTASGMCGSMLGFMPLRGQRVPNDGPPPAADTADRRRTSHIPPRAARGHDADFLFAIAVRRPGLRLGYAARPGGGPAIWVRDGASWARVVGSPDAYELRLGGPRDVWRDIEDVYAEWVAAGRPARTRHGVTVTPEGQTVWLDSPLAPL